MKEENLLQNQNIFAKKIKIIYIISKALINRVVRLLFTDILLTK